MDKTDEFQRACTLFGGSLQANATNSQSPETLHSLKVISKKCSHLSRLVRETEHTVDSVRILVKGNTNAALFEDPTSKIERLTTIFKRKIDEFGMHKKNIDADIDQVAPNQHTRKHFITITESLANIRVELLQQFQRSLEARSQTVSKYEDRRKKYSHNAVMAPVQIHTPLFARAPIKNNRKVEAAAPLSAVSLEAKTTPQLEETSKFQPYMEEENNDNIAIQIDSQQDGLRKRTQARQSLYSSKARVNQAEDLEKSISDLGKLYSKLTTYVATSGEMLDDINRDMDDTLDNINAGQTELLKYYQELSTNRGFIIRLFAAIIFIIALFLFFRF